MRETDEQIEAMREFRVLRRERLWLKFILAVRRCLADGALEAGYNPNQPRGDDRRWGEGGDACVERVADRSVRPIDILEEDRKGDHIFELHVNKSHHFLIQRVIASRYVNTDLIQVGEKWASSFPTLEAANKLINKTVAANQEKIDNYLNSKITKRVTPLYVFSSSGSPTGYEAYAKNARSEPIIRDSYSVTVVIVEDASGRGFLIRTNFPSNEETN